MKEHSTAQQSRISGKVSIVNKVTILSQHIIFWKSCGRVNITKKMLLKGNDHEQRNPTCACGSVRSLKKLAELTHVCMLAWYWSAPCAFRDGGETKKWALWAALALTCSALENTASDKCGWLLWKQKLSIKSWVHCVSALETHCFMAFTSSISKELGNNANVI